MRKSKRKTSMVGFFVTQEFADRIDAAAEVEMLNRATYLRRVIAAALPPPRALIEVEAASS